MPVSYDDYVKSPGIDVEYTAEMVRELKKCSEDFFHFCRYIKIVHPDLGRIEFKPRKYQKKSLELIKNHRFTIHLFCRQSGKCVHGNTKIKIRRKSTGLIEEISIHDLFIKFLKKH